MNRVICAYKKRAELRLEHGWVLLVMNINNQVWGLVLAIAVKSTVIYYLIPIKLGIHCCGNARIVVFPSRILATDHPRIGCFRGHGNLTASLVIAIIRQS